MSEVQSDGLDEALSGAVRAAVSSAAAAAAQLARMREQYAREVEQRGLEAARDFERRRQAMWEDTRAQLLPVMQDQWWEGAEPEDIGRAYANVRAWEGHPEVAPFADRMRSEVRARYGVDLDEVDDLADRLGPRESAERSQAEQDRAEAQRLMEDADRAEAETSTDDPEREAQEHDRAATAAADARGMYDSAERRTAMADQMRQSGIAPEVVDGRMTADTGQGTPVSEAVRSERHAPRARRGRGKALRSREMSRGR